MFKNTDMEVRFVCSRNSKEASMTGLWWTMQNAVNETQGGIREYARARSCRAFKEIT